MKILHIMPILGVGGASRLLSELLPMLNKEMEASFLISRYVDKTFLPKLQNAGVSVRVMGNGVQDPFQVFKIIKELRNNYDVIHVHLFPMLYWVAIANLFVKRELVYTEHSTYNKRRNKWYLAPFERWAYSRYSKIISISNQTESNLKSWLNVAGDDKRFAVINNGVNLNEFKNCEHERVYPHTLIMVARFVPAKDQETVIKAMTLLGEDVNLIFVGDGEKIDVCKSLAKDLKVDGRVHFVGTQSDVPRWIGKADIGIQSSHWEGFGLTAVEMMAGGLPVVASDVEGVKQVVEGAGLLFPHGDYEKLADIVNKLLSDQSYYEMVKRRCIERSKMYDIKTMVDSYINVYKDVIQRSRK